MEASLPRVIPREYIIHKIRVYLKLELLYIILSYYNFKYSSSNSLVPSSGRIHRCNHRSKSLKR